MEILTDSIEVRTRGNTHIVDVTAETGALLEKRGFREGQVLLFVPGSTASLTTVEYEDGLLRDFPEFFDRIAPRGIRYHHEEAWHDGNGHSHVRASLLGPSLTVPFKDGRLLLGTWQQIVLIDFDNRARTRRLVVQITGTRQ
ncbi:MAG: secondary thiamine-phosphate synthase enzyme YjbQ [Thermoanaerobaculia bacterium]|nr:secondary thiamine-phosphate synthase enzyme YjbQ [Thermoanaerobaculia bacterium]